MMVQARLAEREPRFYGEDSYRRGLRSVARALWLGLVSHDQFAAAMVSALDVGLRAAAAEGARACGISPDEFTAVESRRLADEIYSQWQYIPGVADFIIANSKANKGKWGTVAARIELWVPAYRRVASTANALACADRKMKCVRVLPTAQPCRSCLGLETRVYRNSVWLANDCIFPTKSTDCKGFRCAHRLLPTDEPITKGRFPRGLLRQ